MIRIFKRIKPIPKLRIKKNANKNNLQLGYSPKWIIQLDPKIIKITILYSLLITHS